MHEGNRIDHPRIGTERFNYELMRHEILLDTGWTAKHHYDKDRRTLVPLAPAKMASCIDAAKQEWETKSKLFQTDQAELIRQAIMLRAERDAWKKLYDDKAAENTRLRTMIQPATDREGELLSEITRLKQQLWLPTEPGSHPYHGPTKPDPETGNPVPIHDLDHEGFHKAVGNVIAGKIIPAARRQMQEALKNAPKEKPAFPVGGSKDDPRRIGWRMNDAV